LDLDMCQIVCLHNIAKILVAPKNANFPWVN